MARLTDDMLVLVESGAGNAVADYVEGLMAQRDALLAALKDIVPPMPPADAICHNGVCSQAKCAHCSRIAAALAAIAKSEGR